MAIIQGMCRNCGSLIMFDDRDDKCECVFCHCVFPSAEAVQIINAPEGRTFANEKFEPSNDGTKHNATRVFSVESLEKQIARDEIKRANNPEQKKNEYEVQASDVKAPKPLLIGLISGIVVVAAVILIITYPMYNKRTALRSDIESSIDSVFDGIMEVDTTTDEQGKYYNGFSVFGQTCQYMNAITMDQIDDSDAVTVFENYCALRAEKLGLGGDIYEGVQLKIYCDEGYFTVTGNGGDVNAEFTADAEITED
jgi:hypothetical protein